MERRWKRRRRHRSDASAASGPAARELGYLFVVTYGRSGSTLVQGILNSIPGYLIRGENRQVLRHLYAFDSAAKAQRRWQRRKQRKRGEEAGSSRVTQPFFGMDNYPREKALRLIRRLAVETLMRPEPGTRVTGFKEIQWGEPDTPEFVDWLRDVFPGARFVINTRELEDVSQSHWWGDEHNALEELREREKILLAVRDRLGSAAYHVHYDDYTADPNVLAGLFAWLGEPFDLDRIQSVMSVRHSIKRGPEKQAAIAREKGLRTRAIDSARALGLTFEEIRHGPVASLEAAASARGLEPSQVIKTLVVRIAEGDYRFVLVPGDREISWPKLRGLLGVSRMSMPPAEEALEATGYARGTITPLGSSTDWPVIADATLTGRVSIGGGEHGVSLTVEATELVTALQATVADVTDPV